MPDPPQPESPTQGEADADSAPDPIQEITNIRNEPTDIDLRQILAKQEVGKFDFDRDFGVIKNEDDFERRLREFNTMDDKPMEDDETEPRSDFPVDPKIQRRYVLRVGKAILNMEGATDKKIKDRKPASKSWKASAKSKANVPAEEDPGDKEKNSTAVTFLSGLKSAEVELASWKIVTLSRDAQEGRLSRGTYGSQETSFMHFDSWTKRIECIIDYLKTSKTTARRIIREGDLRMKKFVADPKTDVETTERNRTLNCKRAEEKDVANKAKAAVLREEERQSHSPIGTQARNDPETPTTAQNGPSTPENGSPVPTDASSTAALAPASTNDGDDHEAACSSRPGQIIRQAIINYISPAKQQSDPSTINEFTPESVGGDFTPPVLPPRFSPKGNQRPGQNSRASTTGLSAITSSPSSTVQRAQRAGFPSFPGGMSFQGGISGGPGTRASANKRSRLSSEPQDEDYGPGTRGANANRTPKRQKWYATRSGSDLDDYDIEREEDDDYDEDRDE